MKATSRTTRRALHQRSRHQDARRTRAHGTAPREGSASRGSTADSCLGVATPSQAGLKPYATATGYKPYSTSQQYNRLNKFVERLAGVRVLDPACGSGNFLYVSLQLLLGLEKEVIAFGTQT